MNENPRDQHLSTSTALDDEQRVRVLSPAMLVFKRFIRNKLAITGTIFIAGMFLFSFVGGWLMPYGESEVFTEYVDMSKDYAGASRNTEYKFTTVDGSDFPMIARSQFVLAINNNSPSFSAQGVDYTLEDIGAEFYRISALQEVATAAMIGGKYTIVTAEGVTDPGLKNAFMRAIEEKRDSFESGGTTYIVVPQKKNVKACVSRPIAIATLYIFDFASQDADMGFEFRHEAALAYSALMSQAAGVQPFEVGDARYELALEEGMATIYALSGGERIVYANISEYIVQAVYGDVFLTIDYKNKVKDCINEGITEFTFADETGEERTYEILRKNEQWTIKWVEETLVTQSYKFPSREHPLGTDGNGMDLLTRIMYGGRVSLMIGFIVVIIETTIGVMLGGIAGYFGKAIDNLIMRIVDIFNCIPSLPLIIILGAMMDELRVDPQARMILLMLVLGILGWPSIARLVRGQILSLREQEFMVAAEATGLSVSRRIFKHLVPNVIPQLIVVSTMSLGNIILTESVLSFLGLGVKFPFASWGNIINAVSNVHVMTNYLFVWIPAGLCILITVLGFNFIGDGLRDAFDPKMKR
jgi:peptide/nickel transport system permease protein